MQILLMIVLLMSALSCGVDEFSARSPFARGSFGGEVRPPVDYYRSLLAARFNASNKSTPHGKVFLDRRRYTLLFGQKVQCFAG